MKNYLYNKVLYNNLYNKVLPLTISAQVYNVLIKSVAPQESVLVEYVPLRIVAPTSLNAQAQTLVRLEFIVLTIRIVLYQERVQEA